MNNSLTVKNGGWLNGVGGWVVRRGYGVWCRIDNENLKAKVKVILYYITLLLKSSKPGPLLRICNWVGHLSQGTKNNVKRGPEKNLLKSIKLRLLA